ncbi:MAG TPA: hypothetical protein VKE70_19935, partial [Candidatus Solibacter sp.]|nr:hypothetical protein [Candidatus Solibacter sp.]
MRLLLLIVLAPILHAADPWTPDDIYRFRDAVEVRIHPEGSTIAWVETFADRKADAAYSNLYLISSSDRQPRQLTTGGFRDTNPRYSPDGRQLAFLSDRSESRQIWIRHLIDARPRQLTRAESPPLAFAWSPDSS